MDNLWPQFHKKQEVTPKSIFEEQVAFFNELGLGLRAVLNDRLDLDTNLTYTLRIQSPALSGFTLTVFTAWNRPTRMFPVTIVDLITTTTYECKNAEELKADLKTIFNTTELIDSIQNLITQGESDTF